MIEALIADHVCSLPPLLPPGALWTCPECGAKWICADIGVRLGMWNRTFKEQLK